MLESKLLFNLQSCLNYLLLFYGSLILAMFWVPPDQLLISALTRRSLGLKFHRNGQQQEINLQFLTAKQMLLAGVDTNRWLS